jgi:hypothetical protein
VLPAAQASGVATSGWANDVVAALAAITNPARAFLYQATAVTTIADGSGIWTPVVWDASAVDTEGGWSGSQYVCQAGWDGYYLCIGDVEFNDDPTALGVRRATFGHNGVAITGRCPGFGLVPNDGNVHIQVVHEVFLNEGDYVELLAQQSSGGGLDTSINGVKTSSLSVSWRAAA